MSGRTLQCGDNVLRGRLQQSDDVTNKLFARLDVNQFLYGGIAQIDAIFHACSFQNRFRIRLAELLDQLGGTLTHVGEHDRRFAFQRREHLLVNLPGLFESLDKQRIFRNHQLHFLFETKLSQSSGLLCVQFRSIGNVVVSVCGELLGQTINYNFFLFPVHRLSVYLFSRDLGSICKPGLIVVERNILFT